MIGLSFSAPWVLSALVTLPGLWWLLRALPPRPRIVIFPPLDILKPDIDAKPEPKTIPLWMMILRMTLAATLILAMAGPRLNPPSPLSDSEQPLLLMIDNGWSTAPDWINRISFLRSRLDDAARRDRPVALVVSGAKPSAINPQSANDLRSVLDALTPQAFETSWRDHQHMVTSFLERFPDAEILIATAPVERASESTLLDDLFANKSIKFVQTTKPLHALAGLQNDQDALSIRVIRSGFDQSAPKKLVAYNARGEALAETTVTFKADEAESFARFTISSELRRPITRIALIDDPSAGATWLMGSDDQRRRVGIINTRETEQANKLADPAWYITQALAPFSDLYQPRTGLTESLRSMIDAKLDAIIISDGAQLTSAALNSLREYLDQGGVLIRFAGTQAAKKDDDLWPVPLRPTDRALGGALDWDTPRRLSPFPPTSPFYDIPLRDDVVIKRQWLAEPSSTLSRLSWATLEDGTPLVTSAAKGRGRIILFHCAVDPAWSTLPLSGLFVDLLRRSVTVGVSSGERGALPNDTPLPPLSILDGYGKFTDALIGIEPMIPSRQSRADKTHPSGLYGTAERMVPLPVLTASDQIKPTLVPQSAKTTLIALDQSLDIRMTPGLLCLALILFMIDTVFRFLGSRPLWHWRRMLAALAFCIVACLIAPHETKAASPVLKDQDAARDTRLAFIVTGNAMIDEKSRYGLEGLSLFLRDHTAIEPAPPAALDLETDTLDLYPLIYWPMIAGEAEPSATARGKIETYMRNGGLLVIDTQDAGYISGSTGETAEASLLKAIFSSIDVPPLEPVPNNHVILRAFYLLNTIPGRYATGTTWIEALPAETRQNDRPVQSGDGVSPLVVTSNDLAGAWAFTGDGRVLYPLEATLPRQREMALRAGVNLVIYALTGNYKSDQIHVPALLERLGK